MKMYWRKFIGLWLRSLQTDQRRNGQKRAYKDRTTAITSAMRSWNAIVCMGNRWRRTVERGKSQEHTMIDWNVNEIKQHISREISPLSSPFSVSSEGMIKIRRGGATWTSMDETPDDKSTGPSRILLSDSEPLIMRFDTEWHQTLIYNRVENFWISRRKPVRNCPNFFYTYCFYVKSYMNLCK